MTRSIKIASAGERTAALYRARINSISVRGLRWVLPIAAVALLSSYGLFVQRTIKVDTKTHTGRINTGTVSKVLDNLAMMDPSYEGYNKKDGSRYRVSAKKAITDLSRDKPIKLLDIDGAFQQPNGQRTDIKANRGLFDQKLGTLSLEGGVNVDAPNGLTVALNSAVINTKTSQITSNEPVLVKLPSAEVRSNIMQLDQRAREIVFSEGVAARLQPAGNAASAGQAPKSDAAAGSVLGFGGGSKSPIEITSATLSIAEKRRTAQFEGNVHALQDGRKLQAPKLVVMFTGGAGFAGFGESTDGSDGSGPKQGRLRQIVARDGVKISEGANQLRARTAIFDAEANKAELINDVRITSAGNRTINADRASVDTTTNKVILNGSVVATQPNSLMRGRRMIYEPKIGRLQLASPSSKGAPRGNIFVRFRQRAAAGKSRRPKKAAPRGIAFSTNPDAPIEITARSLDVRDPKSMARFDGRVRARQGDLLLTTPRLTAEYDGRIGLLNEPGDRKRSKTKPMKLRFIRASKPVSVSSGKDMRAVGESAEFDLLANKVTIAGNVILEQGRQIVRGDRLVIDLKTGLSRMKNAAPENNTAKPLTFGAAPRVTANPGQRDCGGQMCAVFFPQDVKKNQVARKRKTKRGSAGSSGRTVPAKRRTGDGWAASSSRDTN